MPWRSHQPASPLRLRATAQALRRLADNVVNCGLYNFDEPYARMPAGLPPDMLCDIAAQLEERARQ